MPNGPHQSVTGASTADSGLPCSVQRILRVLRASAILLGLAVLLWAIADAILIIFLAVSLAVMLHGDCSMRYGLISKSRSIVLLLLLALVCVVAHAVEAVRHRAAPDRAFAACDHADRDGGNDRDARDRGCTHRRAARRRADGRHHARLCRGHSRGSRQLAETVDALRLRWIHAFP